MKTARDWSELMPKLPLLSTKPLLAEHRTISLIKEVQLDARKQGMTDAAEIVHPLPDFPVGELPDTIKNPSIDYSTGVRRGLVIAENAILNARDQLK